MTSDQENTGGTLGAIETLAASDLEDAEYHRLGGFLRESGRLDDPQLFRLRVRRVAHILIVRTKLREAATGGLYRDLAENFEEQIRTLEKARDLAGPLSELGEGLAALISKTHGAAFAHTSPLSAIWANSEVLGTLAGKSRRCASSYGDFRDASGSPMLAKCNDTHSSSTVQSLE